VIEVASADPSFSKELETALLADLRDLSVQGVNDSINLAARSPDGKLLAGLAATTSYGWLRINMLWVIKDRRNAGIGKDLVRQAIDFGIARQCHSSWLETSNPAARSFYERLGFQVFATLANADLPPAEHIRWFLRQDLK